MTSAAPKLSAPPHRRPSVPDPTFYPTEDNMGEDSLQTFILELLRPLVERWFALHKKPTFVGADQFIYYKQFDPHRVVAPDLYVLPGVKPGRRIKSWKVWKTGIVPSFALEVVSSNDVGKDYQDVPGRYAELGVSELIIFDPDHATSDDRVRWQRYRRLARRGFVRVETSNADRMRSRVLGCTLRVVGEGDDARLRLGTGVSGEELFPTEAESERSQKESALAQKESALRRVEELEALLAGKRRKH